MTEPAWSMAGVPTRPGVYLFKDGGGRVLYVGKARNLRARLTTYRRPGGDGRLLVSFLESDARSVETIVTRTEQEALLLEDTGTVVLDPGFEAELGAEGILFVSDVAGPERPADLDLERADPVRLEVFGNRFMSIAEQMGAVLRNTSVSTNIKERLDYSCAVFDEAGGLVANAPHIPVHLGAMAETVRIARERFPDLEEGDAVMTNDPQAGGSHLPDVTIVTPVFCGPSAASFFVASRGHHADLGGKTPGSMPADSTCLEEEGVVFEPFLLVRRGRFDEVRVRDLLNGARYPARNPDDNVAELEAMLAANRAGEKTCQGCRIDIPKRRASDKWLQEARDHIARQDFRRAARAAQEASRHEPDRDETKVVLAEAREPAVHRLGDRPGSRRVGPVRVERVGQGHVAHPEPLVGA